MNRSGRHPLPIRACWAPKCGAPVVFLANRATGRGVPVNPDSLSEEDRSILEASGRSFDLDFDPKRHQTHKITCKDREYQPEKVTRRRQRAKASAQGTLFKPPPAPWETD